MESNLTEIAMKTDKKVPLGRKTNPYGKRAILKMVGSSIMDRVKQKAKALTTVHSEEMTKSQIKKRDEIADSMSTREFNKRYGKDRGRDVKYATATKLAMKKESNEIVEKNKSGDSSLHDWFSKSKSSDGKPGWVQLGGKYAGKPCAKQPGQTTKPKCGSSKMKRSLNKKEEDAAFRRKNKQDPNPNRKGKAINVKTESTQIHEGEKDACYHKVKSRYSVWPSAYASGALVKCRKVGAKNWGNKSKKEEFDMKIKGFQITICIAR